MFGINEHIFNPNEIANTVNKKMENHHKITNRNKMNKNSRFQDACFCCSFTLHGYINCILSNDFQRNLSSYPHNSIFPMHIIETTIVVSVTLSFP